MLPISIGRPKSIQLIKDAYRNDKIVGTVAQKDPDIENPKYQDLHSIGTIGQIVKLLEMPDGSTTAIIREEKNGPAGTGFRGPLFCCKGQNYT